MKRSSGGTPEGKNEEKSAAKLMEQEGRGMINFEEELKKFHPSMDVNEAEDAIYSRDLTDVTDILREMLQDEKEKKGNRTR